MFYHTSKVKESFSKVGLNLSGLDLGDEEVKQVVKYTKENPWINEIRLDNNKITDQGAFVLAEMIAANEYLNIFSIANNLIGSDGLKALADAMKNHLGLYEVNLSGLVGDQLSSQSIVEFISSSNRIETLNISNVGLTKANESALAKAITDNKSLHFLDLSGNSQLQAGSDLATAFSKNATLVDLNISDSIEHNPASVVEFLNGFANNTSIQKLTLGGIKLTTKKTASSLQDFLLKTQSIKFLGLASGEFSQDNIESMSTGLANNTSIEELNLANAGLRSVGPLGMAINSNKVLKVIDLRGQAANDFEKMFGGFLLNNTIRRIFLDSNNLPDEFFEILKDVLITSGFLEVSFNDNFCGDKGAASLIEVARVRHDLINSISLRSNALGNEGLRTLAHRLINCKNLYSLDVSYPKNKMAGNEGLRWFASALWSDPSLVELNLSGYAYDDTTQTISDIGEALKENFHLLKLYLNHHARAQPSVFTKLAKDLKRSRIIKLCLENCNLGLEAATALAELIVEKLGMDEFRLSNNNFDGACIQKLAEALKLLNRGNIGLSKLALNNNPIGPAGAAYLGEALKVNTTLVKLLLAHTNLDDNAIVSISGGLKNNSRIIELDLSDNNFSDNGVVALADAVKNNTTLRWLRLGELNLSEVGRKALYEIHLVMMRNHGMVDPHKLSQSLSEHQAADRGCGQHFFQENKNCLRDDPIDSQQPQSDVDFRANL